MTPRNGGPGRVWEAIRAMIEYTVVGTGGTLALDIEPQGLLGAQTAIAHSGCRGGEFSQRYDPWEPLGHLWPTLRFEGRVAA